MGIGGPGEQELCDLWDGEGACDGRLPGGMKNCCHDEHKHVQSDRAQKLAQGWEAWNLAVVLAVLPYQGWITQVMVTTTPNLPMANGPPLAEDVPVFLRNCNFRI